MKRCIENIEWAVAEFVVSKLGSLQRRFLMDDHECPRIRGRAESVIDQTGAKQLVSRKEFRQVPDVVAGGAIHSAAASLKSRGICEDGCLHRELRSIRKGGDFPDVLIVLFGERTLRIGVPIIIDHALDVAGGYRPEPQ